MSFFFDPLLPNVGGSTYTLTADGASFALSGQAASFRRALRLTATAGTFAETGQAVTFVRAYQLVADAGVYSFIGRAVAFPGFEASEDGNGVNTISISITIGL